MTDCGTDDQWFDREVCPAPCDSMHTRCGDCGRAIDGCSFEGGPTPELWALMITDVDRSWIEGPFTEDEALSRKYRLWDRGYDRISMARYEARPDD